jgi:tetratricopeptide (TPR) repeat protein
MGTTCRGSLFVGIVLFVLASPVQAAGWLVPRGPSPESEPYRYDPAMLRKIPRDFLDDAPACVLYAATNYLVEPDGTVEIVVHDVTRLNSRKSIERLGEYRQITYDPAFEKVTLNTLRVHKPDGRVIDVGPRHIHLRDVATDFQVYAPDKQLIISFPSLEVGDVIEVKWTTRGKNPEHGGQFFTHYTFGTDDYPVVLDELRVRLPAGRPLRSASVGGKLDPIVKKETGSLFYRWSARDCQRLPRDDDRPTREELRLQVSCSTFATWDEVAAWKRRLRSGCWECTRDMKSLVRQVTRGLKTPEEKARALTYWVRRNVRYVSAGVKHDYTPHRPGDVIANRHGDCKDTSQLLAVLLREAGIPSALVTLGVRGDGQVLESVPSPWGTHGILLVTLDGKNHWIDTTAALAAWDFLPRACRNRQCYILDDKGIRLLHTPPLSANEHRFETTTEVTIACDGSTQSTRTLVYQGLAAENQRDRWLEVPAGEQRRLAAVRLLDSNSEARLSRLEIDETALPRFDQPVRARVSFTIPGQFAGKDRDGSFTDNRVWNFLLGYNLDHARKVPLELYAPTDSRHTYIVHCPGGTEFTGYPRAHTIRSKWGTFTRSARWIGKGYRTARIEFHLRLEKTRVEPADFAAFRTFHKDVYDAYRAWLTLEPVQHLTHIPELELQVHLCPRDSAAAATLARIYLHHERRADARRVLARARSFRADDAVLWELSVKAAEGSREAEKLQRALVKRFPGNPTHAIALGAMLIDRGKGKLAEPLLTSLARSAVPAAASLASYHLARCSLNSGKPERALEYLKDAARHKGSKEHTVLIQMLRGRVLEKLARFDDAREAYEQALAANPKAEDTLLSLLELSIARKDAIRGSRYLRCYAVLIEDNFLGLVRAADQALRLGRYEDAFELASRARDKGFHESVQRVLGMVWLHRGDHAKAVFHLDRADPTPPVLAARMQAQIALGNLTLAEREEQRARRLASPSAELQTMMDQVRALAERRDLLLAAAPVSRPERSRWITALDCLVCAEEAHARGGSVAQMEALLNRAAGEKLPVGPVHALRGLLALERGRLIQALAEAEQALLLNPRDPRGWYVRGRARLERGTLGAVEDLRKAAALGGRKDVAVLRTLAEAQRQAGSPEQARETLSEALKLRPGDGELRELLRTWEREGQETRPR